MDLSRYVDDLQHRLATAADAGGDDARRLAERLMTPLDAAVRLVLIDALSAAAGEISAELAPGSVDLRIRAGEPEFVVAVPAAPPAATDGTVTPGTQAAPGAVGDPEGDGSTSRTTLRLPDALKAQVEVAAAREGLSVNAWLVRAVAAALSQAPDPARPGGRPDRRGAARVTGWVR